MHKFNMSFALLLHVIMGSKSYFAALEITRMEFQTSYNNWGRCSQSFVGNALTSACLQRNKRMSRLTRACYRETNACSAKIHTIPSALLSHFQQEPVQPKKRLLWTKNHMSQANRRLLWLRCFKNTLLLHLTRLLQSLSYSEKNHIIPLQIFPKLWFNPKFLQSNLFSSSILL